MLRAVLFDFGGVVTTSPFDAFATYERANDLPAGLIRRINSTDPDTNAWAGLERGDLSVDEFCTRFEAEAAALGHRVDGYAVIGLLGGAIRPEMVEAIRRIGDAGLITACLTNNIKPNHADGGDATTRPDVAEAMALFDYVVESSVIGVRKPEPEFYRKALAIIGVDATEALFCDDLGINLKPARAMGMTTVKVTDPTTALTEMGQHLALPLV